MLLHFAHSLGASSARPLAV